MPKLKPTATNMVDKYLDEVLEQGGATGLTTEQRALLRTELLVEIERRLRLVSLESLNEAGLAAYADLIQLGKIGLADQITFFTAHIPNYEVLLQKTLAEVATEFVAHSQAAT